LCGPEVLFIDGDRAGVELIKIALPYFGRKSVQRLIFFKDTVQTVLNNGALRPKIDSGSCGAVGFHL
jgi:hypothetical protein